MARIKMSREDRAKQFAPFDALKGLSNALRLKEYQHERVLKGDMSDEMISDISKTLLEIDNSDIVKLTCFIDGHELTAQGYCKIDFDKHYIEIDGKKINFDDIKKIEII